MVITTGYTEGCFFTTTGNSQTVVVCLSELSNGVNPVRIFIVVGEVSRVIIEVHQLHNAGSHIALFRIEVRLLEHHGIAITIQHLHAVRLPGATETIAEVHTGFTTRTTAGRNLDNTIRTTRTPDSSCCSVFQHVDLLDIIGADLQQCGEFLFVHIFSVQLLAIIVFQNIAIDYDKRLLVTIDRGHTTQTHGSTGTKVTGVGYDVQTGNLSLQRFTCSFKGKTLHGIHVQGLLCH